MCYFAFGPPHSQAEHFFVALSFVNQLSLNQFMSVAAQDLECNNYILVF